MRERGFGVLEVLIIIVIIIVIVVFGFGIQDDGEASVATQCDQLLQECIAFCSPNAQHVHKNAIARRRHVARTNLRTGSSRWSPIENASVDTSRAGRSATDQ